MDPKIMQMLLEKYGPHVANQMEPNQLPLALDPDAPDTSKAAQAQSAIDAVAARGQKMVQPALNAYEAVRAPRQAAIDVVAKQLDLNKQGDPEFRQTARTVLDAGLPDVSDALLLGGGKLAGKIIEGAGEFNKLGTLGNQIGSMGKDVTAAGALEKSVNEGAGRLGLVDSAADRNADALKIVQKQRGQEFLDRQEAIRQMNKAKRGQ